MTDIVERLREPPECDRTRCVVQRLQAADEIELLRIQVKAYRENEPKLISEIETLRGDLLTGNSELLDQAEIEARKFYVERNVLLAENKRLLAQIKRLNAGLGYTDYYEEIKELRSEVDRLRKRNAKDCVDVQVLLDQDQFSKEENTKLRQEIERMKRGDVGWNHDIARSALGDEIKRQGFGQSGTIIWKHPGDGKHTACKCEPGYSDPMCPEGSDGDANG